MPIGMAIAQDVGRRRGSTRGIAGTIPGTTIPGGTGTIRSTIPHGIVGVIPTITTHGIRPATTAIMVIMVEAISVAEAVAYHRI